MTVYFATDHAGFELKNTILAYVQNELGFNVEDCGAVAVDLEDDYPEFVQKAAKAVSESPSDRKAIIFGGSGQGEAMVANRYANVRAVVYYGEVGVDQHDAKGNTLSIIQSSRMHNDANILSIGARFVDTDDAKEAVKIWLETEFTHEERHSRRIRSIEIN